MHECNYTQARTITRKQKHTSPHARALSHTHCDSGATGPSNYRHAAVLPTQPDANGDPVDQTHNERQRTPSRRARRRSVVEARAAPRTGDLRLQCLRHTRRASCNTRHADCRITIQHPDPIPLMRIKSLLCSEQQPQENHTFTTALPPQPVALAPRFLRVPLVLACVPHWAKAR